jgi:predicted transcriptional regulator
MKEEKEKIILTRIQNLTSDVPMSRIIKGEFDISNGRKAILSLEEKGYIKTKMKGKLRTIKLTKLGQERLKELWV